MNAEARFMETLFSGLDTVDRYETEAMQEQAIALIPLDDLAANVSKRISRSQGALSEDDFPDLQVQELMKWFKGSFFKWVDQDVLSRPTWASFIALLDNYEASEGKAERVTRAEIKEESDFLDLNLKMPCLRYVLNADM